MRQTVKVSLVAALLVTSAASWAAAQERLSDGVLGQVGVVTQNLYIGADIFRIFDAETPEDIPFVVAGILQTAMDTDFPERAEALADQIASTEPHLIGLQEVSLIRVQSPGDFLIGNPQPAEDVLYDYLDILLDALEARGLDYVVAGVVENADIELPFFAGVGGGGQPLFDDVRLTDHDVILARSDVATANVVADNFEINIEFNIGGVDVVLYRGYVYVDATVRGRTYRFANTHLEVASLVSEVQAAQMFELVNVLHYSPYPVILVGDLNSEPTDPFPQPYPLARAAGYWDMWLERSGRPDPGYTCCQAETVDNTLSMLDERIDHILVRRSRALRLRPVRGPVRSEVLGDEERDKTISGLWPSDHGGVYSRMLIPALPF
ncbi:MAG: endonuclease [Acidobacteria bacterium]|nr:MAG: endonuclease [Acidobacteriota bacterium]